MLFRSESIRYNLNGELELGDPNDVRMKHSGGEHLLNLKTSDDMSADVTLTFPADDGPPSYYLKTDGNGVLTWDSPAGSGNMNTDTYDNNTDGSEAGVVDNAEKLGDNPPAHYLSVDNHTDGTTNKLFTSTLKTKLDGIQSGAQVTDNTTVKTAGAVMDDEIAETNGFVRRLGTGFDIDTNTYLTTEADPQVATLTNLKWCTTDGSIIN